jgi:hypothetical protein
MLTRATGTLTKAIASATVTRAMAMACVRLVVRVALRAVHFVSLVTSSFTSLRVLSVSDRLQVVGIDAAVDAAQVIKLEPFWYGAAKQLVRDSVCKFLNSSVSYLTVAVICIGDSSDPQPTPGIRLRDASIKQSLYQWFCCKLIAGHATPFKSYCLGLRSVGALLRPVAFNYTINPPHSLQEYN